MAHTYYNCSNCGKLTDLELYPIVRLPLVQKMSEEQLCFECAYWKRWLDNPEEGVSVISHGIYKINSPLEERPYLTCPPTSLTYLFDLEEKKGYVCKDLIFRGLIPPAFRTIIPDQYKIISGKAYMACYHFGHGCCLSKGCFDRYTCYWYNKKAAEGDTPWNEIPEDYQQGSEGCPSYIDKHYLYDTH